MIAKPIVHQRTGGKSGGYPSKAVELSSRDLRTSQNHWSMISQHIHPRRGDSKLEDVRPTLVQDSLRKLEVSRRYKGQKSFVLVLKKWAGNVVADDFVDDLSARGASTIGPLR